MKKKLVVLMMAGMLALTFGVGTSHAALDWYTVTVTEVGNSVGIPYMTATGTTPAFASTIFFFNTSSAAALNQMMAAALTGWANGGKCKIYADPALGTGSIIYSASVSN